MYLSKEVHKFRLVIHPYLNHFVFWLFLSLILFRLATGWTVRGIWYWWRRYLMHLSRPALEPTSFPVDCVWNVMAHAQKPDFVSCKTDESHLNRQGRQFCRILAADVCASAVVMLHSPCSEVVWRVLDTHSIRQFPIHFPSCASPYTITFQLDYTVNNGSLSQVYS